METQRLSADEQANFFKSFVQVLVQKVQALVQKFNTFSIFFFCRIIQLLENLGCLRDRQSMHNCQDHLLMYPQSGPLYRFIPPHAQYIPAPP